MPQVFDITVEWGIEEPLPELADLPDGSICDDCWQVRSLIGTCACL